MKKIKEAKKALVICYRAMLREGRTPRGKRTATESQKRTYDHFFNAAVELEKAVELMKRRRKATAST